MTTFSHSLSADRGLGVDVIAHLDVQMVSARRLLSIVLEQGGAIRARAVHKVVALAVDLTHADVHVGRAASDGRALLRPEPQRLLVGAHGLAETPLRTPYIRQRDRASEGIGDVPGQPQSRHALGIPRVPGLEVPARPGREPHECRGRSTAEVVISRRKFERPPRVPHRAWPIAANLPSQSNGECIMRNMKSSSSALPGPVSQAISVSDPSI